MRPTRTKKADAVEYKRVFHRIGLLYNQPPVKDELPFI